MDLIQLKQEIDTLLNLVTTLMADIQRLDKYIESCEDPESAVSMTDVLLHKGTEFEYITAKLKVSVETYIAEKKKLGLPIDFSYTKLLNQILKG